MRRRSRRTGSRVGALAAADPRLRARVEGRAQRGRARSAPSRVRAPGRLRARAGRPVAAPRKRDSSRGARRWPDHGGQHGLHVLGQHARVPVHQRPGLRGAQQRDDRRAATGRPRSPPTGACSARSPARSRAAPPRRARAAPAPCSLQQLLRRERGLERGEQVAAVAAEQQLPLERRVRVAELDAHQEAVELRLGQREGADLVQRVLRRDHEERLAAAGRSGRRR